MSSLHRIRYGSGKVNTRGWWCCHHHIGRAEDGDRDKEEGKGRPCFGDLGSLAAATKTVRIGEAKGITGLKCHEPPEAKE